MSKWSSQRHPISKTLRVMNRVKRLGTATTTDDKGQADLKGVTKDETSTKEGSNMKMINSNVILYNESE